MIAMQADTDEATAAAVVSAVEDVILPTWQARQQQLDRIDGWLKWSPDPVVMPKRARDERGDLRAMACEPYIGLAVTTLTQTLAVDGYRSAGESSDAGPWQTWQANGLPSRQVPLYRAALSYGDAYMVVLPPAEPGGRAVMRAFSPRRLVAVYDDPACDEWPMMAADVRRQGDAFTVRYFDAEAVHHLAGRAGALAYLGSTPHRAGVVPVVRYANSIDLEGQTVGEVEPLIPLAKRINQTVFDRLVTQHFNSWKVWTIAGIDLSKGPAATNATTPGRTGPHEVSDAEAAAIRLRQGDMLTAADPATKFGALPETSLDGFIHAYETDVRTFAAAAQLPPVLFGDISNVGADTLAMLQHGLEARSAERRLAFGDAHAQALRLAALLEGDQASAADFAAGVTWQDTSIRSMAQAVDALGKMATMLGVPVEQLWSRIPTVTRTDVDDWKAARRKGDPLAQMADHLATRAEAMASADE